MQWKCFSCGELPDETGKKLLKQNVTYLESTKGNKWISDQLTAFEKNWVIILIWIFYEKNPNIAA